MRLLLQNVMSWYWWLYQDSFHHSFFCILVLSCFDGCLTLSAEFTAPSMSSVQVYKYWVIFYYLVWSILIYSYFNIYVNYFVGWYHQIWYLNSTNTSAICLRISLRRWITSLTTFYLVYNILCFNKVLSYTWDFVYFFLKSILSGSVDSSWTRGVFRSRSEAALVYLTLFGSETQTSSLSTQSDHH